MKKEVTSHLLYPRSMAVGFLFLSASISEINHLRPDRSFLILPLQDLNRATVR